MGDGRIDRQMKSTIDAFAQQCADLRARVAELEAERAELEETASANWIHCQEVDNYLIELLGDDFPTDADTSAENTKAAIRKLMANTAGFTIDAARDGEAADD